MAFTTSTTFATIAYTIPITNAHPDAFPPSSRLGRPNTPITNTIPITNAFPPPSHRWWPNAYTNTITNTINAAISTASPCLW